MQGFRQQNNLGVDQLNHWLFPVDIFNFSTKYALMLLYFAQKSIWAPKFDAPKSVYRLANGSAGRPGMIPEVFPGKPKFFGRANIEVSWAREKLLKNSNEKLLMTWMKKKSIASSLKRLSSFSSFH